MSRVFKILHLAIPVALQLVLTIIIEMINLVVVGHLGDPELIAGIGIGNMTMNLLGLSIIFGFNSSLDTLISQAAGCGEIKLCGLYLNRGRFVMTILFIPIALLLSNIKTILIKVG